MTGNPKRAVLGAVLLTVLGGLAGAQSMRDTLREDIGLARSRIYPALVNISVVSRDFRGGRTVRFPSAGSGTIVSPAGHVITNYHVARDAVRIVCTLSSGESIPAEVVAHDPPTDLSVLKLRIDRRAAGAPPLPYAGLGDSDLLEVGDLVLAVGNPLSLSSSLTLGVVSNTKRVFSDFRGNDIESLQFDPGNATGMFTQWIQHDALILPGNSGGPLVNLRGEIVGVNTRGGEGYGFASPSRLVRRVLDRILAQGKVERGWLGLSLRPVGKLGREHGVLVADVDPDAPAGRVGIRPGDVLLSLGGQSLDCRFLEEVPVVLGRLADFTPGRPELLRYERDGVALEATIAPAAMSAFVGEEIELRDLGVTLMAITPAVARSRGWPSTAGALVTGVRAGQPLETAKPSIERGDRIDSVGGDRVESLASFRELLARHREKKRIAVGFHREREDLLTVIDLEEKPTPKAGGELAKAWLGVQTQVLTSELATALGLDGRKGFRVTDVYPETEAQKAGLRVGDLIVAVDGEALTSSRPQDSRDLVNRIEDMSVGDEVVLGLLRDGAALDLTCDLQESPASALDAKKVRNDLLELELREITFMDRIAHPWPAEESGLLVTQAVSGGWADMGGLETGDLVLAVDGAAVPDVKAFEARMRAVLEPKPELVRFFVRREFRTTFVFVELDWNEEEKK